MCRNGALRPTLCDTLAHFGLAAPSLIRSPKLAITNGSKGHTLASPRNTTSGASLMNFTPGRTFGVLALLGALCASPLACSDGDQPAETTQRSLSITYPAPAEIVSKSRVRVTGTAENIDQVEVNGQSADVTGGQWEALVAFGEGEVSATVSGGGQEATVEFVVDSLAPTLTLTSPQRATVLDATTASSVMVNGSVVEEGTGLFLVKVGEQIIELD